MRTAHSTARALLGLLLPVVLIACSQPEPSADDGRPPAPPQPSSPVRFIDVAEQAGLTLVSSCGNEKKRYILETTGSGVAIADYDGDGDEDIYVGTAQTVDDWVADRRPKSNALYRNEGDGTFSDVAAEAGTAYAAWTSGVYFADYDNDGDSDLFVAVWGRNRLFRNEGDGTFSDVSEASGLAATAEWSSSAAFGDLDLDGDLDLYVVNYCEFDLADPPFGGATITWKGAEVLMGPQGLTGEADRLYRNNGDGTFSDITREAGIDDFTDPLFGLGVVMSDFDRDGDADIYVANDSVANYLWRNDGGLRFTEMGPFAGVASNEDSRDQAGMGAHTGDFDGDGEIDLVVTNFSHDFNTLYRNHGGLTFSDVTFEANFSDSYDKLVWGVQFFDADLDGWLDLFVVNGHVYPEVDQHAALNTRFKQTNSFYWNEGNGSFVNVSDTAGPGMNVQESSRGLATSDLDRDGDLDLVMTNMEARPNLLLNEGATDSWISLRLVGTRSNRDAIGARVELAAGGRNQVREVNPYGSFQSCSSAAVHFGLGTAEQVDRIFIRWPSGATDELTQLEARHHLTVTEGAGVTAQSAPGASWSAP